MHVQNAMSKRVFKAAWFPITILMLAALGACSPGPADQTLVYEYNTSSTLIADMRMTGTVHAARLQTTLDFSGTRVAQASIQSDFLQSTMVAMGYDRNDINAFQQAALDGSVQFPTATQSAPQFTVNQPQVTAVAPPTQAALPTTVPDANAPRLDNVALAAEVGNDDCAAGVSSQFTMDTQLIYLTMRAVNVPAFSTFTSEWLRPDGQVRSFDWTPDFAIDNACVWMYIDQSDEAFIEGVWSVTMNLNGAPAAEALNFAIEDMMMDEP